MHVTRSAHEPTCETLSLLGISIIGGSVGFPQLLLLAVKKISNFFALTCGGDANILGASPCTRAIEPLGETSTT